MGIFDFFRRKKDSASVAKDRLQIIVARERGGSAGTPDYLPQLQQELLAVVAKYEKLDLDQVSVRVDTKEDVDVLELNIVLPDQDPPVPNNRRQSVAFAT